MGAGRDFTGREWLLGGHHWEPFQKFPTLPGSCLFPLLDAHVLCWPQLEYLHSFIPLCLYLGHSSHLNALSTSIAIYESLGACVHAHAKLLQLCLTFCDPMDCNPQGSSIHSSPGKNTGVGCHSLLQAIFPTQG